MKRHMIGSRSESRSGSRSGPEVGPEEEVPAVAKEEVPAVVVYPGLPCPAIPEPCTPPYYTARVHHGYDGHRCTRSEHAGTEQE